ncbi:MAG: bifunctional 2-dehydro-3-deoxygluconokinase/2-dehydro-3-deoxygalactonoki nase [Anaerolineae bacterium]
MAEFITFGETMLRLSAAGNQRLEAAQSFEVHPGGAESNVAAALARLGKSAAWISRLPDNELGRLTASRLRSYGIDLSGVSWSAAEQNERMGLYFVEFGAPPRPTRVRYDRADSAFSHMQPAELPLEMIRAAKWLHLTGITFGLLGNCTETARVLLSEARRADLIISFDVNYRAALWSPTTAGAALEPICEQAEVIFCALRDAVALFGMENHLRRATAGLHARFGKKVIVSNGSSGAAAMDAAGLVECPAFPVTIVDRVGAGDAFAAGVICRLSEGASLLDALRFGAAAAALKLTTVGDIALISRAEVEMVLRDNPPTLIR